MKDIYACNNCGCVVVGVPYKPIGCHACDGGEMVLDNESGLDILLDRMDELSYR